MKLYKWLSVLVCAVILSSCSSKITEGEIYDKEFRPERTWTNIVPIYHTTGKTGFFTYIPIVNHHPDEYIIYIRSGERSPEGEYNTAKYYVSESVFNECEIGMWFEYTPDRGDLKEEPVTKQKAR